MVITISNTVMVKAIGGDDFRYNKVGVMCVPTT